MDAAPATPTRPWRLRTGHHYFVSQARNATHATHEPAARRRDTVFANAKASFPVPPFYYSDKFLRKSISSRPSIATPLAVEPETENDTAGKIDRHPFKISLRKAAQATTISISYNDQHVKTPLGVAGQGHDSWWRRRHFRSADRCAKQWRDPVRCPRISAHCASIPPAARFAACPAE